MGMCIEVVGRTVYTVDLTDEEVEKIRHYIEEHKEELPCVNMKNNILWAIEELGSEIEFYSDGKYTEADFCTEEIKWSEYEEQTPEEILEGAGISTDE